jgi:hypothetical protein
MLSARFGVSACLLVLVAPLVQCDRLDSEKAESTFDVDSSVDPAVEIDMDPEGPGFTENVLLRSDVVLDPEREDVIVVASLQMRSSDESIVPAPAFEDVGPVQGFEHEPPTPDTPDFAVCGDAPVCFTATPNGSDRAVVIVTCVAPGEATVEFDLVHQRVQLDPDAVLPSDRATFLGDPVATKVETRVTCNGVDCPGGADKNACGGCEPLQNANGEPAEVVGVCGTCGLGTYGCDPDDLNRVICEGDDASSPVDLVISGLVSASSVFTGYSAADSVDGDLTTSWFSIGIADTNPTYTWTMNGGRACITNIGFDNNTMHSNPDFQTDYGFGSVTLRVLDDGTEVFTREVDLSGMPDPNVDESIDPPVGGTSVELVFSDHDDPACGGFSELYLTGLE